ncbi:hypothetical protein LTR78_008368 [Recurvomyces mirabilis]|uniref:Uncharacterized protein n=1 Tax=Recurvomyces mirabilis TaxID=574656 RepID=A0AAE0TTD9_9PEZI|nr:hypothetical protein LTR78_008368 [Recurvomyces mirabilis]
MSARQPISGEHGMAIEMETQGNTTDRESHEAGHMKDMIASVANVNTAGDYLDENDDEELRATKSTRQDLVNMQRMGKEQQLVRHFRQMSMTSFVAIATAAWEIGLFVISPALIDGGRSGLIYSVIWNFVGFAPVYLSMAEMASMAPIAGAQYHWVSEFAPANMQRFLSYITGTDGLRQWHGKLETRLAFSSPVVGSLIQTMILVNDENYAFPSWQGTLLAFAAMIIAYIGNVYGSKVLPYWQNAVFAIHIIAYFGYIVPVWVKAPTATHKQVWADFQNEGGWSSMGLTLLVGQLTGISAQVGIDTAGE